MIEMQTQSLEITKFDKLYPRLKYHLCMRTLKLYFKHPSEIALLDDIWTC